jgi:hypothetical protein
MDKLTDYQKIIRRILNEYIELDKRQPTPGVEYLLVADDKGGHYMWLNLGWSNNKRLNAETVYVRLRDGKFWIETDWTERGIALDLLEAGVPKEDIVLAFHHPDVRPHTDFAAA